MYMAHSKKAEKLTKNYIINEVAAKLNDLKPLNREIAVAAGYSEQTALKQNIKSSDLYVNMVNELTNKLGGNIFYYVEMIDKDIKCGEVEKLTLDTKLKHLNTMVSIVKTLSPTFKQKITKKDEEGYSTTWTTLN